MVILQRVDLIFTVLRLVAVCGGFAWTYLHPNLEYREALSPLFVFFGLYSLILYGFILLRPARTNTWYLGAMVLDLFFINEVIRQSGGIESTFYLAFFLLAALHSFYFGLRTGLGIALAANLLFLLTNWNELGHVYFGDLLLQVGMLFVVAGAIGVMAAQIRQTQEALERKLNEVTALSELSKTINTTLKLDEVLQTLVVWTVRIMGIKACAIYMIDEEKGFLTPRAGHGFRRPNWGKIIPMEGSLSGEVVKSGVPKAVEDISDHRCNFFHRSMLQEEGIVSALCVPLVAKNKSLGTLMVFTEERREFGEPEVELLEALASHACNAIENATLYEEMSSLYLSIIKAFVAAIDAKDSYTRGHSEYVVEYSRIIAEELGLPGEQIEVLATAAVLHDVGKIGISGNILRKPSNLTDEEYAEIKMHVIIGGEIVSQIPALKDTVPIIYHHHERWDGSGYPEGIAGENIPLGARIIAVADAFEAMTSNRIYRSALPMEKAIAEIRNGAGSQFDPDVVKAFVAAIEKGRFDDTGPVLEQTAAPNWSHLLTSRGAS